MALMLAIADASCAGICDLVILGMVKAAIIRMIVTTISNSIRVKPRSRFRLDMSRVLTQVRAENNHIIDVPQPRPFPQRNTELLSTAQPMSKAQRFGDKRLTEELS